MERTAFNLMSYPYRVGSEPRTGLTFRETGLPGMRPAGRITAPPGSRIRHPAQGPPYLMVPKLGRTDEYDVLTAELAAQYARKGEMGLSMEIMPEDGP